MQNLTLDDVQVMLEGEDIQAFSTGPLICRVKLGRETILRAIMGNNDLWKEMMEQIRSKNILTNVGLEMVVHDYVVDFIDTIGHVIEATRLPQTTMDKRNFGNVQASSNSQFTWPTHLLQMAAEAVTNYAIGVITKNATTNEETGKEPLHSMWQQGRNSQQLVLEDFPTSQASTRMKSHPSRIPREIEEVSSDEEDDDGDNDGNHAYVLLIQIDKNDKRKVLERIESWPPPGRCFRRPTTAGNDVGVTRSKSLSNIVSPHPLLESWSQDSDAAYTDGHVCERERSSSKVEFSQSIAETAVESTLDQAVEQAMQELTEEVHANEVPQSLGEDGCIAPQAHLQNNCEPCCNMVPQRHPEAHDMKYDSGAWCHVCQPRRLLEKKGSPVSMGGIGPVVESSAEKATQVVSDAKLSALENRGRPSLVTASSLRKILDESSGRRPLNVKQHSCSSLKTRGKRRKPRSLPRRAIYKSRSLGTMPSDVLDRRKSWEKQTSQSAMGLEQASITIMNEFCNGDHCGSSLSSDRAAFRSDRAWEHVIGVKGDLDHNKEGECSTVAPRFREASFRSKSVGSLRVEPSIRRQTISTRPTERRRSFSSSMLVDSRSDKKAYGRVALDEQRVAWDGSSETVSKRHHMTRTIGSQIEANTASLRSHYHDDTEWDENSHSRSIGERRVSWRKDVVDKDTEMTYGQLSDEESLASEGALSFAEDSEHIEELNKPPIEAAKGGANDMFCRTGSNEQATSTNVGKRQVSWVHGIENDVEVINEQHCGTRPLSMEPNSSTTQSVEQEERPAEGHSAEPVKEAAGALPAFEKGARDAKSALTSFRATLVKDSRKCIQRKGKNPPIPMLSPGRKSKATATLPSRILRKSLSLCSVPSDGLAPKKTSRRFKSDPSVGLRQASLAILDNFVSGMDGEDDDSGSERCSNGPDTECHRARVNSSTPDEAEISLNSENDRNVERRERFVRQGRNENWPLWEASVEATTHAQK